MKQKPIPQNIDPRLIRTDLGTQVRNASSEETIREYAEAMENGAVFPPVTVFFDLVTGLYILADGFHRLFAHLWARPNDPILVEQYLGNAEDARWFGIGANKTHGLKRSNEDKRNAVEQALLHPNGAEKSDRQIAAHTGVAFKTVGNIRRRMIQEKRLCEIHSRVGADGRRYNISNIGKKPVESNTCEKCWHYQSTRCTMDGKTHKPLEPACHDFTEIPLPEPETKVDETDYSDEELRPYEPKEVSRRPARRKKGEYAEVALCVSNTDLAAIEIRNLLGETYLAALTQSGMKILRHD